MICDQINLARDAVTARTTWYILYFYWDEEPQLDRKTTGDIRRTRKDHSVRKRVCRQSDVRGSIPSIQSSHVNHQKPGTVTLVNLVLPNDGEHNRLQNAEFVRLPRGRWAGGSAIGCSYFGTARHAVNLIWPELGRSQETDEIWRARMAKAWWFVGPVGTSGTAMRIVLERHGNMHKKPRRIVCIRWVQLGR